MSFQTSGNAVIGRACNTAIRPPATAHSTSTGTPWRSWIRAPSPASSRTRASDSSEPPDRRTTPSADTTYSSGVTVPPTRASPRPGAALTTVSVREPVTGLAVNSTPAASAGTIRCTTTASATSVMPLRAR
ncbi:hypothetical protein GCM10027184_01190 [Saccharothrix stipae]